MPKSGPKASGYYRFPTLHGQTIVFVCEDDLWTVEAAGGIARRLTAGLGEVTSPFLSPDGKHLAFTGREEGPPEVYVMPAAGGPARRLTFLGSSCRVAGWSRDGKSILFESDSRLAFGRVMQLFTVPVEGGPAEPLPHGLARAISYGPGGGVALGRNTADPARWKRYRGGMAGDIWVDAKGKGQFRRLIRIAGNLASPMWVGRRIFFISDHEGIGNLYSCLPSGRGLKRHTDHDEYYARNASTDGKRIVYHCGAELFIHDPATGSSDRVEVELHSPRTQRNRKFVGAARNWESYSIHPEGPALAVVSRGRVFTMGNWEGPVAQHGEPDGARYRLVDGLSDGERLVAITDVEGEEAPIIFHGDATKRPKLVRGLDIGCAVEMVASPKKDEIVLENHRCELIHVDLAKAKSRILEKSRHGGFNGIAWSPDGRWIAYGMPLTQQTAIIKLCEVKTGKTWPVTRPVLRDINPSFDPEGKYLYFVSFREFNPVYDNLHFDLNFPWGMRPYLVTLREDLRSPFQVTSDDGGGDEERGKSKGRGKKEKTLRIDLKGIEDRVVAFPVHEGRYDQIEGLFDGKVLFSSFPAEGSLDTDWYSQTPPASGMIEMYVFSEKKTEHLFDDVTDFTVSADRKTLAYRSGDRLRVMKAGEKPGEDASETAPGRKSGWIDLDRIKVSVSPPDEWRQMYNEAWRLQRDHFWTPDMSGVDWPKVHERYLPLLDRVATRSEFSDLMWEMQGELGTSHAYEVGGDYRASPNYHQGFLGADFAYDKKRNGYRIDHIVRGDTWDEKRDSPLNSPGADVRAGDVLRAVGGRRLGPRLTPQELLVNQADSEVVLTIARGRKTHVVAVKALKDESPARYREWVEKNRRFVHKATKRRVGYVHIPDMGPQGFAEFHRYYLAEIQHDGLLIDARFNGGGHVSQLILEKLVRRRVGYDLQRWGEPEPYPGDSVAGPKVALTNEWAGSDGDIFSHCFKLMKLGPLIGKRTWGGVIGIWPRHALVDGSITTQPEFSFWFEDVGWAVENHGTDPDIEVEITPQDYARGKDPQLDRGVKEIVRLLRTHPPKKPDFGGRPVLKLPEARRRRGKKG